METEESPDESRQPLRANADGLRTRTSEDASSKNRRFPTQIGDPDDQAPNELTIGVFTLILLLAIVFDLFSFILEGLPFLGGMLENIVAVPLFNKIFKNYEKPKNKKGRIITMVVSAAIEFIPIVNLLPNYTVQVILFYLKNSA